MPNQALQRTTAGVTGRAQATQPTHHRPLDRSFRHAFTRNRLRPHVLRRPQWSLSLGSLGVATLTLKLTIQNLILGTIALLGTAGFAASTDKPADAPRPASVQRYIVCKLPAKKAVWHPLPRRDGDFIMAVILTLHEWRPSIPPGALHARTPGNRFQVRAITTDDKHFDVAFAGENLVWVGWSIYEVPRATIEQINIQIARALNSK